MICPNSSLTSPRSSFQRRLKKYLKRRLCLAMRKLHRHAHTRKEVPCTFSHHEGRTENKDSQQIDFDAILFLNQVGKIITSNDGAVMLSTSNIKIQMPPLFSPIRPCTRGGALAPFSADRLNFIFPGRFEATRPFTNPHLFVAGTQTVIDIRYCGPDREDVQAKITGAVTDVPSSWEVL